MNAVTNPPQADNITLYYREGSSDKVYQCSIELNGEMFVVNFAFGRRGTTLTTGTKTSEPVSYEEARKVFDKLVREKTAKGYRPGDSGTPYQHAAGERNTGIHPQLLNPINEAEVERLILDPAWCMQEKKDGRRVLIRKENGVVTGINRKGLAIGLPVSIMQSAIDIPCDFVIDGECVEDVLFCFDLLSLSGESALDEPYRHRVSALTTLLMAAAPSDIQIVESAIKTTDKQAMLNRLKQEKREGVVFKRLDALYTPGRPNSGGTQLKYKFYATVSVVVGRVNQQRSVEVRLFNGTDWQTAGNVTIPPNHKVPSVGGVVEVRYLYALRESGCLYQPVYLGVRDDIGQQACVVSQLKFKPTEEEE